MTISADMGMPGHLKTLQSMNIGPLVPFASLVLPCVMDKYLESLNDRQKQALGQVMPVGGSKQVYLQVTDSPTPPILLTLAQPPKLGTISLEEATEQRIPGIRLTTGDLHMLSNGLTIGGMLRLPWRLKRQVITSPGLVKLFLPLLKLGGAELKDMGIKLKAQLNPLASILP